MEPPHIGHHREFPPPPFQFRAHILPAHVGLKGPFESTRKHSPTCIQVELDHRDLLQEDEEFERQKLVAEVAEELRPQHPQPEAFKLCVCQRKNNLVSSAW